ncbi:AMP-binding protein [Sneathiella aquimaris]|uniref:AMP-binding protein n=1 Tax=Sneathiella aquimaris TaxID=2599305 RepID=UPI001469B1FE|nr:AMP-binding protein [Sneathiella aquimaris]
MMQTVYEAFCRSVELYPQNAFLCVPPLEGRSYNPEGVEITYAEAAVAVDEIRATYTRSGYTVGHRVAFLLENRPDYILHLLALNSLGVSCVPINPDYRHAEMLYQMDHSDADLVICIDTRFTDLEKVAAERGNLPVIGMGAFSDGVPEPHREVDGGKPGLQTEASLLYTSGTTGRPKGCILTNDYHLTAGKWYSELGGLVDIRPGKERLFNPLPLFHMNSAVVSLGCMILTGGCLIIPDRFHPRSWWREVCDTRATIIHYLGVVPPMLLNQPVSEWETAHSVRFGIGAGVEPELHAVFEKRYGFALLEIWGMTETGRIFAVNSEPRKIDTRAFGRPLLGFEAKIIDDTGAECPRGVAGELVVRSSEETPRKGFFSGYLKNEQATEEAWTDGWFHTGDTVVQDETDMLYFVDRKKNIIRRSGENIAAAEVEAVLQSHEAVAQVAVIAVKDEVREEEVLACIVLMEDAEASETLAKELFDFSAERLAYYKPPGWILFLDQLPTTGTQKIQKTQIFEVGEDPRAADAIVDLREFKKKVRQ